MSGFTGEFCELKAEQDFLLYIGENYDTKEYDGLVLNSDAGLIERRVNLDENSRVRGSCVTMLDGEAVVFGGGTHTDFREQVKSGKGKLALN